MKLSRNPPFALAIVLALVALAALPLHPAAADAPTPGKVFLPLTLAAAASGQPLRVDPVWRWGDVNSYSGSTGIRVVDLNQDGQNETLIGGSKMLVAMRHVGQYRFDQTWAVPMGATLGENWETPVGASWGLADVAGLGADQIWVLGYDGRLVAYRPYEYTPVAEKTLALGGAGPLMAVTTDLLGDSGPELVVWTSDYVIRAFDLPTLSPVWSYRVGASPDLIRWSAILVAQFDDDPSKEVAVSAGQVIDVAQGAEQWHYANGFGADMQAGDLDHDGKAELVGVTPEPELTAYDVDLRAPKWEFNTYGSPDKIELADIVGDPTPEVVVGERMGGPKVEVFDAPSQSLIWSAWGGEDGVDGLGVGDANDDGENDLIWGSGGASSGANVVSFAPAQATRSAFTYPDDDGPYQAVALQMDADDALEIVIFARSTRNGYRAGRYFILDSATGLVEPGLKLDFDISASYFSDIDWKPLLANIDDDPFDELILQAGVWLFALDNDGAQLGARVCDEGCIPDWVGDADGDGQLELVAHTTNRVKVLRLNDLADEWQTAAFSAGDKKVAVGDVDGDGHMEALFHGEVSYLQAYDLVTHALDWQMPATQHALTVAIGNADAAGGLEIATVEGGRVCFYDAQTRAALGCPGQLLPSQSWRYDLQFARMSATDYPQLIVAQADGVQLFNHPFDAVATQTLPDPWSAITLADTDNDHHIDLLVGSTVSVTRYRGGAAFVDVIPPLARRIAPVAGADQVTRDAFAEARFNKAMDPATITAANAQLRAGATALPASLSYDPAMRALRLTPQALLPAMTAITVWLGPGLADLAGNGLDGNVNGLGGEANDAYSWSFTTGSGVDDAGPALLDLALSPNPAWSGMRVALTATADDANPAGSTRVQRAEYFLDAAGAPGTGMPLAAADGAFDERQEAVSAALDTSGWTGSRTIYARAQDTTGNWGAVSSMTLTLPPEQAANSGQYGYDAAHTGYNPNQGHISSFTRAWESDLGATFGAAGTALSRVAVANGLVAANVNPLGLIALRTSDGGELWRKTSIGQYSANPPSIAYGNIYFQQGNQSTDMRLYALNAQTGQEVWAAPFVAQWVHYQAPVIADSKVFINVGYLAGMYGYDALNGSQLWFAQTSPQQGMWAPAYRDETIYTWIDDTLQAWDPTNGAEKWLLRTNPCCGYYPARIAVISPATAYVTRGTSTAPALIAIDLATHTERWRQAGKFTDTAAVADNEVYGLDGARLRVFDAATGAELWSYDAGRPLIGSPLVTAGNIFFASEDHTWMFDRATRSLLWETAQGGWLTVANDQLFIAGKNGVLAAFNAVK